VYQIIMHKKPIIILLLFVAILGVMVFCRVIITSKKQIRTDTKKEIQTLAKIMTIKGILPAYEYFNKNFYSYSDNVRHYAGHFLGEHIYKTYGLAGLRHCYSQTEYGCIHGFLLNGYLKEGRGFLVDVVGQCKTDLPLGCMHGLGHAMLLTRGYTDADLKATLDDCNSLDVKQSGKSECLQGVYMEYNDRFVKKDDISAVWFEPREFDPTKPLAPCDSQPLELQPICFRELVLYWTNISSITPEKMAFYCKTITNQVGAHECFWSLGGHLAGMYDNKLSVSVSSCERVAPAGVVSCVQGALQSVAFEAQTSIQALCPSLPNIYKKDCRSW
jgi:hypothetical protein